MPMGSTEITPDGYVRIDESDLSRLHLRHLTSMVDTSIAIPECLLDESTEVVTGYTEWVGTWSGAPVSLGWDWGFLRGAICLLSAAEIRTNIQLIVDGGSVSSPLLSRMRLARWLETVPWGETAILRLVQVQGRN
jgi:hypothetical protein